MKLCLVPPGSDATWRSRNWEVIVKSRILVSAIAGALGIMTSNLAMAQVGRDVAATEAPQNESEAPVRRNQGKPGDQSKPGATQLEVIKVSAEHRDQTINELPSSISVVSSAQLENTNAVSAEDYLKVIPNVSFNEGGRNGLRQVSISIRGLSDLKTREKTSVQSAFATYVDEVSLGNLAAGQPNPNIYDVDTVEVLRGPQGVYFGRNAEAGAINIRTKKPESNLGGGFDIGYGSYQSYQLAGYANVPVSDTLLTRLSVQYEDSNSWLKNIGAAGGDGSNDYVNLRAQVRWKPTDSTTVDLQFSRAKDNEGPDLKLSTCLANNSKFFSDPFNPAALNVGCHLPKSLRWILDAQIAKGAIPPPAGQIDYGNDRLISQNQATYTNNLVTYSIAKVEHYLNDDWRVASVTGYVESSSKQYLDLDKTNLDDFDRSGNFTTAGWSQEFRLQTFNERKVDWTLGLYGYGQNFNAANAIIQKTFDIHFPWFPGDHPNENNIHNKQTGTALFGNGDWHMSDQLSLTFGLRYSHDNYSTRWYNVYAACAKRVVGTPLNPGCLMLAGSPTIILGPDGKLYESGGRIAQTVNTTGNTSSSDLSGQIALNWQPTEESNYYVSVSKGYKPAGSVASPGAPGGVSSVSVFGKETLWNYEIGGNQYFFDRRALLSYSLFWMDWKDMQVDVNQDFCLQPDGSYTPYTGGPIGDCLVTPLDRTVNAKKASSKGFELSGLFRVSDNLTLGTSIGYANARFKEFVNPLSLSSKDADLSGLRLPFAPKWTISARADYTFVVADKEAGIGATWSYRSQTAPGTSEATPNPDIENFPWYVPQFHTLDLRASLKLTEKSKLLFTVQNALNSNYFTGYDPFSVAGVTIDYHPRTYFLRWSTKL
jgi:iron complex outermembrane receptor protein